MCEEDKALLSNRAMHSGRTSSKERSSVTELALAGRLDADTAKLVMVVGSV